MRMIIGVATMRTGDSLPGDIPLAVANATSITHKDVFVVRNTAELNRGIVCSYQYIYENTTADIICLLHDDVLVRERGWDKRIMAEFEDPKVGVVGMGGALQHGHPDLYKTPYKLQNLARYFYRSNVDDAEVHGERFEGSCDVAVLDGFCLAVRRDILERSGGWAFIAQGCNLFCYDYAICAMARRLGYRVRMVGARCHHRGGGTSVEKNITEATSQEAYDLSHLWYFENFMDVMPCKVK